MTSTNAHRASLVLADRIRRLQDDYQRAKDTDRPALAHELDLSYHGALNMARRHSREICVSQNYGRTRPVERP